MSGISAELLQPSNERAVASDTRALFKTDCVNVFGWPTCDYARQRWPRLASCEWPRAVSSDVSTLSRPPTPTYTSVPAIRLIAFLHSCRMVRSPRLRKASMCSLARLSRRSSNRGSVRKARACVGEKIILRRWQTNKDVVKIKSFRSLGRSMPRSFDMISVGSWHIAVRIRFRHLAASRTMSLTYTFNEEYDLFDNQLDNRKFLHQLHGKVFQEKRHRPASHQVNDLLALNVCGAVQGQANHDELLQVTHDLDHDVRVLQAQQVAADHFC
ncbi:unnamed protein product [Sphagnum troendelagicum]|uniref:Uncharacterized protein n=1 Tax=Sphagnum troendelagicum TaxID=128251 RepID=A0ABP0V5S0_9BRYO